MSINVKENFWVRSDQGKVAGICQSLADSFQIEAWIVRLVWIVLTLLWGSGLILYLLLTITTPKASELRQAYQRKILGVCLLISRRTDLEIGLVRFLAVTALTISLGLVFFFYLLLYFILPEEG